ncbi:replication initiation factor domain-containing protein [Enterococcus faecalis]|uniref:replication initiation factor domain-containing protein n=1 Tax=Enterococcus faecalis TaxID=1351 RepID=UPI0001F0C73B|nr:replication initiation factor domain-containing protein [Enterococcus faecalis]EFT95171.1 replication initiation factor [Enterococcus faecalis TX0012]
MRFEKLVREKRLSYGVSQQKLATMSGYSREHINRIELGKELPSEAAKAKLLVTLEQLNPEKELELIFDYVRLRFDTHDIQHIVEDVLKMKMKYLVYEDYAFYGYIAKYVFSHIEVMISPEEDAKGTLIELKGQGCREFESILLAQNRTWFDFFMACEKENVHYKRIDLAINDKVGVLSIPYLVEKCRKRELTSKFRSFQSLGSGKLIKDEEQFVGQTLYIGSLKSDIYFCFYEKNIEQLIKKGIAIEEAEIKNRYEIRLKNDRAYHAMQDLLIYRDCERTIFDILNSYLVFLEKGISKNKAKWKIDPMWVQFVGEERQTLRLTSNPKPVELSQTLLWIRRQVAPTLKMLLLIDQKNQTNRMNEILSETELDKKHEKMIEQHTTILQEVILSDE